MELVLYHGSERIIMQPRPDAGSGCRDFGRGFYCTRSPDMAREWSVSRGRDGFVSRYILDPAELTVLDLSSSGFTILHWLAVLLANRRFDTVTPLAVEARDYILSAFHVDCSGYDCITGWRGDDSYFSFAQDFLSGAISCRHLIRSMAPGETGQQFVLKSRKAFDALRFDGYETASHSEWYPKRRSRDESARREYLDAERYRIQSGDLFVTQILGERMRPDDPRLQ